MMPQRDGPDVTPVVGRRRAGRVHYTSPNLIALLRGKRTRDDEDIATELDRGGPDGVAARSPGARSWGALLPVLAIVAWAALGVLVWTVIRLL
jgi:hypothetical protein